MMGATIGLSGCSGDKNISSVNSTIDIESVYYRSWEDDGEKADIAHMLREFVQTIGEALVTDEQVENVIELFKPYMEQEVYTESRDTYISKYKYGFFRHKIEIEDIRIVYRDKEEEQSDFDSYYVYFTAGGRKTYLKFSIDENNKI